MSEDTKADLGVLGMGVMGRNLALNANDRGFAVAVYNRSRDATDEVIAKNPGAGLLPTYALAEFVARLARPRRVLIMVKSGPPVDAVLDDLLRLLEPGDLVVDGGNELYTNTARRVERAQAAGLAYLGMGVSGGEEGARHGPSMMPGGTEDAYRQMAPILEKMAAQVEDGPCVTHIGPGGSGHFVKMVHNGIEYGDMQLIAEAYDLLKHVGGLSNAELADTFAAWNEGELESFLIEITAQVFRRADDLGEGDLVDAILDTAQMKGTGTWTVAEAAHLGAPVPTIAAAVDARMMSGQRPLRQRAAKALTGPDPSRAERAELVEDVREALYAAKACSYAQGMRMLAQASEDNGWGIDLSEVSRIWKAGCIIRARFLGRLQRVFTEQPDLPNLLLDPAFAEELGGRQGAWRRVVTRAVAAGIPATAFMASLGYYDALRRERLPANLIQAQRDFFGAHTYQRLDREGTFHTQWIPGPPGPKGDGA